MNWTCHTQAVEVEGQTVHVKELDGHSFGEFLSVARQAEKEYQAALTLVAHTVCDQGGKLLYTVEQAGKLPRRIVDALVDAASKLNKLGASVDDTKSPAPE